MGLHSIIYWNHGGDRSKEAKWGRIHRTFQLERIIGGSTSFHLIHSSFHFSVSKSETTSMHTRHQQSKSKYNGKQGYNPVVFSRTTTYNDPNIESSKKETQQESLAQLVHQTDRNGQQLSKAKNSSISVRNVEPVNSKSNGKVSNSSGKGLTKFLSSIYSALGMNDHSNANSGNGNLRSRFARHGSTSDVATAKKRQENVMNERVVASLPNTTKKSLLAPQESAYKGKKCLVLDLDETLVHSSFRPVPNADIIIPVEIEGTVHQVYVIKRPGVDEFLEILGKHYEVVIYTASLSKYADPLLDVLDKEHRVIRHRLFREHCVYYEGNYVKDMSMLGRDIKQSIIVDNSPVAYLFQPENAIGCTSFIDDPSDKEMQSIQNFLLSVKDVDDVREYLHKWAPPVKQTSFGRN